MTSQWLVITAEASVGVSQRHLGVTSISIANRTAAFIEMATFAIHQNPINYVSLPHIHYRVLALLW